MKNTLIILFFIFSTIASATDYYISSSGNDTNNGLSSSTPWKTIAKVNTSFSIIKPGDRILFKRGDTFYGALKISKSGLPSSPIIIGDYGTGANPIITGFSNVTAWTNLGSYIWESTSAVSTLSTCNMVTINGVNTGMGRYPNTGYLTYQTYLTNTSITSTSLSGTPNWTGAEVVIKKQRWIIDRNLITAQSSGTLTYNPSSNYYGQNNWGFFIQNDARTLDTANEWYYNPSTKKIRVYSTISPISVKVASVDTLVFMNYNNYITFDNISFTGANNSAIYLKSCLNLTIQNCDFNFCYNGIFGQNWGLSTNFKLQNCIINHTNNNAVSLSTTYSSATISNNIIKNTGMIAGMGGSGDNNYTGIMLDHISNSLIQYNEIDSSGYCGISFPGGNFTTVTNNLVNYFCMIKDDGGGIYTHTTSTRKIISSNIVLNGIGNGEGVNNLGSSEAMGIYIDRNSNTSGVQILNNSIANISLAGIFLSDAIDIIIRNNTVCNSTVVGLLIRNFVSSTYIRNLTVKNNVFFSKNSIQLSLKAITLHNDISSFGIIDSNYYARPIDDNLTFQTCIDNSPTITNRTLSGWQAFTNLDANSHKSPIAIANTNDIRFEYNASKTNKTITLDQPVIDVKGIKYVNSITLLPFTSAVLMIDPNPAQPVIPIYSGSIVDNATPSLLEIDYDISLSNIVPAASAFTVQVNSVARTINSVAISGPKVLITLSNAVVYGDIVTVAYTKPSSNPLQTTSGGQAVTISAQPVTNNVNSVVPVYVSAAVANATPSILEMTYNMILANIVPAASAFSVRVNSVVRTVNTVAISGTKVQLTLASPIINGDVVTVSYTKPSSNPLQTTSGGQAVTIIAQPVVNNCINAANTPPVVTISNPQKGNKYENLSNITIDAVASDPDGTIVKVEFYSGSEKLVELTSLPYSYTWKDVSAGTYSITAVATDNLNATTTSLPIEFSVGTTTKYDANSEIIKLYPNPNDGHFSIEFINPLQNERSEIIITDLTGKQVYKGFVSLEETKKQIDLSYIKSGIYILIIIYKEIFVTKKFIIE